MQTNPTWTLLAKKLNKEATAVELDELKRLLEADPVLAFTASQLEQCWQAEPKTIPPTPFSSAGSGENHPKITG